MTMIKGLYRRSFLYFLLTSFIYVQQVAQAQEIATGHVIHLKSGSLIPTANAARWMDSMRALPVGKGPVQVLMHFNTLPTPAQRDALRAKGIPLLDYIPKNTYTALVQTPIETGDLVDNAVHSIINMQPEWKAGSYLWNQISKQQGNVLVLVSFYSSIDPLAIKRFITSIGGQITRGPMEKYGSYKVIIAGSRVRALAQWYGVRYISPVTDMVPLDLQSRPAVKGNVAISSPLYGGYGLAGDGVTVGIGDDASGIYHADMKDRITDFNPSPTAEHGEFVNGIAGGASNIDPLSGGISPHVALVDYLYDLILPATGSMYRDYNMTITNNSYEIIAGDCTYAGTYDAYSQLLDTLAVQFPEVQHVFASGNDGGNNCSPYLPGFATVGGGYQPAKNNIVVGSITDLYDEAGDESRGPVKDGRIKPDIVAIGLGAYSTVGIDNYVWSAGTSMASPQAASGLAVLTQRYKQLHGGAQPRADLLKSVLLNGALDLGNPGPDYSYGFGAMDIYRSLLIVDSGNYHSNTISNGDSQSFTLTVPPNTGQLKIMLYWNDVPASPSSAKALVNDLDLTVQDPSSTIHLPLVLDATPANVNNNATEQADHINNAEQVVINNPAAGTYTIRTKGYSIPYGPQPYVVAYDIHPNGLKITYPLGGDQVSNIDSIRIFWDAVTTANTFTVQVSPDNGSTWVTIADNVAANARHCDFMPLNLNTSKCIARVMRNITGETSASARFSSNTQPVAHLDSTQCPGYINIHWSPILNASSYYLLRKVGYYMQVVDSVADTAYSFSDMPLDVKSYVAVQPVIEGMPGYRSVAAITIANTGNCTNPVSAGDLMTEKIVFPGNGRMYTSTQFGPGTTLQVTIRDLYRTACSNYTVSWQVNGGLWQSMAGPTAIPADSVTIVSIPSLSLSVPGSYTIRVAVSNHDLPDPQHANDTISYTLLNIPNDTINLATSFMDDFETMGDFSVIHDSIGVSPNGHWDYFNVNDSGRMRSFVSDEITISGNRSISLDENLTTHNGSKNTFTGTFNLSNYDTGTTEVRVDFDYILHGTPKTANGNIVLARGNDTASWSPLYTYDFSAYPGNITHVQSMSLTDAVRSTGHNFSSSCQVSFGQNDTSLIAAINYGNGMTIDNFRLYAVANDAGLVSVISPLPTNCGLASPQPLIVQVHNGVNYTIRNVQMFYSEDGGATRTGSIDSIAAKGTVNYTFTQELNMTEGSTHTVDVWLSEAGDTYTANDSLLNYNFRNSQIINTFPYLESFEAGDGGYYSAGFLDSWQYGTPASPKINKAASGTKAWKTNLTGNYNDLELSYLYSPCFDISSLANPILSFSTALDIENCGNTLCDAAYIEYSFDGQTWLKLGAEGAGTNWYDSTFDVWNTEGFTRWHVASIPLTPPGPGVTVHFRFVLAADPGVTFEGIAVDDIHIFDLIYPIMPASSIVTVTQDLGGNQWTDFTQSNQLLSSVQPNNQSINNTAVTLYPHDTLSSPDATQYTFPRSYTIKASQSPGDSTGIRLYLLDSEVVNVLKDTTCPSCTPVTDAYSLGVTQYDNSVNAAAENGTLADDTGGAFTYYPYRSVQWVPYDKGYYAQINAKPFSEFWFNNGGPTGNFSAGADYLNFVAFRNSSNVTSQWYSLIDTAVNVYTLQWSIDGINFAKVIDTPARHTNPGIYTVNDQDNFSKVSVFWYRLKWTMTDKTDTFYSPIRRVDSSDVAANLVTFNAQMINHQSVLTNWVSYIDGSVDHYILQRAIGDGSFITISTTPSVKHYGQQYYFTDQPAGQISAGTTIRYRLTAVLIDSTNIVLPEQDVEWTAENSFVTIYPNPTLDGTFTILWDADAGTVMQIAIFDATGREMYKTAVTSAQWNNSTTVLAANLASGVYFVCMDIGGSRTTAKIVYE